MKLSKYFPALKHFNIPNMITTLGLVLGIFAAYFLTQQDLRMAIIMLGFAGLMDLMDGWVATKLNQQTEFGQYLDTLVDFFICCIMPIWMVHDLLIHGSLWENPFIVLSLIFYCMCGLWRLAYYNIIEAKKHFTGLPVPGSMMFVTIAIWCVVMYGITVWLVIGTFFVIGLLMISGVQLTKYGLWQKAMGLIALVFGAVVIFS